jgi:hypothetical protein
VGESAQDWPIERGGPVKRELGDEAVSGVTGVVPVALNDLAVHRSALA